MFLVVIMSAATAITLGRTVVLELAHLTRGLVRAATATAAATGTATGTNANTRTATRTSTSTSTSTSTATTADVVIVDPPLLLLDLGERLCDFVSSPWGGVVGRGGGEGKGGERRRRARSDF